MTASPWWHGASPPQRAEAITAQMLAGAGEWWLFGAWGRWYRCGLDGHWYPCPPPSDPTFQRMLGPVLPGAGNPPVPPHLLPVGADLAAGPIASIGFLGDPPQTAVVARVQQALTTALSVNPAQFAVRDNAVAPTAPSTVAAAWATLLWCAGSPVALAEHPLIELFAPYLTTPGHLLRWMIPPDLSQLTVYYGQRLAAGDVAGASFVVRVMHEVATGLTGDPRFQPGAGALAAITAVTLPMAQHDMAAARFGPAAIAHEWQRRCPAEYALPMVRDSAPGEYLRLALYDLSQIVTDLSAPPQGSTEACRAGVAVLAADLQGAPHAVAAVLPWLDPDSSATLQAVLAHPDHPMRRLWPHDGRLPETLRTDRAEKIQALLAASYTLALTWCRLAQVAPPAPGFAVPAAAAAELADPALRAPRSTGELTPWQIIEAARAHLAAQHTEPPASPAAFEPTEPPAFGQPAPGAVFPAFPALPPDPPAPPDRFGPSDIAPEGSPEVPAEHGIPCPEADAPIVEAYGIRFLCGADDVARLLTELRRRGTWAQQLRKQEVSIASAPALVLLGEPSSGQRRLTRMIARALADARLSSGEVHTMHAEDLRERDPEGVRAALDEHAGHVLLLERLDTLVLDEPDGPAYATALYRARVEGVSDTALVATCGTERPAELWATCPELVTEFRIVRLPDLSDPATRIALLGLLADERQVCLSSQAWELARADLTRLRGRGRFTNARVIEVYLERACTNQLARAGETRAIAGAATAALVLTSADLRGIVEDLSI